MKLVFATANKGKLREAREILSPCGIEVISPSDAGLAPEDADVEETGTSFRENALIKARHLYGLLGLGCFADDSGLAVDALGGAPGIYSARYASLDGSGADHDFASNIDRLLHEMKDVEDRRARFVCSVALILDGTCVEYFDGTCEGVIANGRSGNGGFGYDPVFIPDEYPGVSMAELPEKDKNAISHRGHALSAMCEWLSARSQR